MNNNNTDNAVQDSVVGHRFHRALHTKKYRSEIVERKLEYTEREYVQAVWKYFFQYRNIY